MLLLEAQGLSKTFGAHAAVRQLSLKLHAGEVLGIVGESGCGKSTLARLLTGLVTPDAGRILYAGKKPDSMSRLERARFIQMMFQDPAAALHPRLRVGKALGEVLQSVLRLSREAAAEELKGWLPRLDLPIEILNRFPHQLSGGQKQRICLLRALLLKPRVLVCDEPLTALDRMTQARVLQLLQNLQAELGFALVFISHDITTVRAIAHRVAVMYAGLWMECGPARAVLESPRHPYTHYLLQSLPKLYRDQKLKPIPDFQEASLRPPECGCPLVLRCPLATKLCQQQVPLTGSEHAVACVHEGVL
jgi:oligopeptide/dipeptide ABC transporter ATP-binding protein